MLRNNAVEKELDRKTKDRYIGPYEVVRRTEGGSYILKEMNGIVSRRGVAAFRLIPYISRDAENVDEVLDQLEEPSSNEESDVD